MEKRSAIISSIFGNLKNIEDSKFVKGRIFLILFIGLILLNLVFLSAEDLNLKITGTVNDISSDIYLKTNSNAINAIDAYDMLVKDLPSGNYSQFYSNVSNNYLSIDSWNVNPRTLNLVYSISAAQSGTLTFSWPALTGSYDATFVDYGSDSSYTTVVGSNNMRASSSYSTTISNKDKNYIEISVSSYSEPVTIPDTDSSGGGGGGGGETPGKAKRANITVDTTNLEVPLAINTVKTRKITVTNIGNKVGEVVINVQSLGNIVQIEEKSFKLNAGEKKEVEIKFIGPEKPGIYTGKILVNDNEILVSVNVNTKELLFDVGISIPDDLKIIHTGSKLSAQITLIPMGENPRVDVTLNYVIKDFEGRTFLIESETMLIEEQKTFKKTFATQNLPEGNYALGLELTYPNGVATSTSHFTVAGKESFFSKNIYIFIITIITIIVIIAFILLTIRIRRRPESMRKLNRQ